MSSEFSIRTPQQLGAVLKGYRRNRGLKQKDVGKRAGLAQNAISIIETNPERTSLARLAKVLAALELELVVRPREASKGKTDW